MEILKRLKKLSSMSGLSGDESAIANFLCQALKELGLDAHCDPYGNVHGLLLSEKENAKTLLFEAHMDQIGLMVSKIDKGGYIQFTTLGGVDQRILPGMEVVICGKEPIPGVIGGCRKTSRDDDEEKNLKTEEYRIDTGLSEEEARARLSVGDFVCLQGETELMLNQIVSGCAMDNRAGIVSILDCLQKLRRTKSEYTIRVLFSNQEELGLHGAYTGIREMQVDGAIVIDVTHGTTPDVKEETGVFPLGSGAVICRGPNFHYHYTKQLLSLAQEKNVSHEIEVAAAESGTTAWAIQTANGGIPVMLVSIPLRYMHTNVETLLLSDIQAVSDLLYHTAMGGVSLA